MISKTNLRTSYQRSFLIALLAGVCLLAACGKQTVATAGNEFEANLMFDILHSNRFHVKKEKSEGEAKTWDIVVDEGWFGEGEAATAIQVLRDYGLPRPPEPEITSNDSPFGATTDRAQKEKQKRELQTQIERLLYTLPDVIRAGVIVALPTKDPLDLKETEPTATVALVIKDAELKFSDDLVRNQVARAVPNLKPENVYVSITKQSLREIPLEKLEAQRRSNAIFAVGIGVIILLALALGAVWTVARRRRLKVSDDDQKLIEEETDEEFEDVERPLLETEDEE